MQKSLSVRRRMASTKYKIVYVLIAALWFSSGALVPLAHAQASEELVARKPFVATVVTGMALTKNKSGVPLAVTMPRGVNAPLQIINLRTSQSALSQELRTDDIEAAGQAYVALSSRHVLIGTTTGMLYDVDPDKFTATEQSSPEQSHLAFENAVAGGAGVAYFTTVQDGVTHLYSYNSASASWHNLGDFPGTGLGLAYSGGYIYLGNMAAPSLWKVSSSGGTKTSLTLTEVPAGATGLRVGAVSGGYLYVETIGSRALTLIYDQASGNLVDQRAPFGAISAAPFETLAQTVQPAKAASQTAPATTTTSTTQSTAEDTGDSNNGDTDAVVQTSSTVSAQTEIANKPATQSQPASTVASTTTVPVSTPVYYGALSRYDPVTKTVQALGSQAGLEPASGNCWLDANRCLVYGAAGQIGIVTATSRTYKAISPSPIVGGFHNVSTIDISSDDTMYAASTAAGSSVLQVDRDKSLLRKMVAQQHGSVTSLLPTGSVLTAGTSTGSMTLYDTNSAAAVPKFASEVKVGEGSVDALTSTGNGRIAFALNQVGTKTVSMVGIYDVDDQTITAAPQTVLSDQTVASLAYGQGVIYGGGRTTSSASASLFAYDVSKRATKTVVPVPGAKNITSLIVFGDKLYGVADSTVFAVDPSTMTVTGKRPFFQVNAPGNLVAAKGKLIASVGGKIYTLDPADLSDTYVASGAHVAVNSLGDYYYSRGGAIYRMLAPRKATAVGGGLESSSSHLGFSLANLQLSVSALALTAALAAIPILRLRKHRATYTLRR